MCVQGLQTGMIVNEGLGYGLRGERWKEGEDTIGVDGLARGESSRIYGIK